ncbi:MAG: response regulator [Proteobacteria bacterium]|nr:response regulator [Pseudomonadota bacterium]
MKEHNIIKPIDILLVEDNPGDVDLVREALEQGKLYNRLHVVDNGEQAMALLHNQAPYENILKPELILLDLNLPRKSGFEVLAEIKADSELLRIPVVVLTSSQAEEDILKSYNLHANCFVTKPLDLNQFLRVVQSIETFWLSIVMLPHDGDQAKNV